MAMCEVWIVKYEPWSLKHDLWSVKYELSIVNSNWVFFNQGHFAHEFMCIAKNLWYLINSNL